MPIINPSLFCYFCQCDKDVMKMFKRRQRTKRLWRVCISPVNREGSSILGKKGRRRKDFIIRQKYTNKYAINKKIYSVLCQTFFSYIPNQVLRQTWRKKHPDFLSQNSFHHRRSGDKMGTADFQNQKRPTTFAVGLKFTGSPGRT